MKRKADPSWDRDNSDESDGEGKNFSKQAQSSSEVQHPAVDLSKRRIVKLKLPSEIYNESVNKAQNKPTGSFQLTTNLTGNQTSNLSTETKPVGSVSFLSGASNSQPISNKPQSNDSSLAKPNLSLSTESLNSDPFKDTNQTKSTSLFGNLNQGSDLNNGSKSNDSGAASNKPNLASIQTKPDSTQKFGLFGRSTSGEKSPLASTPLVSGKTQTPDKPLDVVKSDSQSNEKPAGGLFANLNKPAQETKPAAFTFGSALFGNKPTTTPQPTATNETPNVDEQPKLTRQDSTQLLRLDSKNTTEEKQLEAAAKKETPESDASNKASETKNINLFNSNAFPTPGQKTISLFGNQTSGNQPFNLTPKPEEKPAETKPEEQTTPTKTEPSKNIFSGLIKSDEKKADAPSGGIFGNKSDNNGAKIGGLFGNNNNKPSGGIFGNLNKSDEKEKAEEKKPEPVAEKKEEPKPEVKPSGLFSQLTPGGPLFGKPQAETVAPLVSNSAEPKQKVSLFKDILPPKEEPKTAADTKPEAETKPVGGLFGKLFNNTGDLSQLAKKDYSATKFDTSGENTENELKEAEKERREKEREKALAEKAQEKPKFNPWANLNNPQPKPELGSSKSGLFGSSSSEGGLFANLNTPKPNLFSKAQTGGLFASALGEKNGGFLQKKDDEEGEEGDDDGEDPEAEKEVLPQGGAPTLNKDAFKYEDTTDKLVAVNVAKFKAPETALFQGGELSLNKPKDGKIYYLIYRYQAQVFPNISKVEFFNPRGDAVTIVAVRQKENKPLKEQVKAMFNEADACKKFKEAFEKNLL